MAKARKPGMKFYLRKGETVTTDGPATIVADRTSRFRVIASRQVKVTCDRTVRDSTKRDL